jgi:hypothetical protein
VSARSGADAAAANAAVGEITATLGEIGGAAERLTEAARGLQAQVDRFKLA